MAYASARVLAHMTNWSPKWTILSGLAQIIGSFFRMQFLSMGMYLSTVSAKSSMPVLSTKSAWAGW